MDGERTYMKFEKVVIKKFRNFDNVELDLSNKNIFIESNMHHCMSFSNWIPALGH